MTVAGHARVSEIPVVRSRRDVGRAGTAPSVRLPLKLVAVFTRQMAMLLRAGSGVVEAIAAIRKQIRKPAHTAVFDGMIADLQDGLTLTDALLRHPRSFGPVYCAIVAAGEASGTLTRMFERLADIVGKQRALRNRLFGALAYPALLVVMCSFILAAMMFFVIPRFHDMFVQLGVDPPAATQALLSTAALVRGHWFVALFLVLGAGAGTAAFLNSRRGRQWLADVQLAVPLFGRLRTNLIHAQVFRTLGTLLGSGVGILEALELVRDATRNARFQRLFQSIENLVTAGGSVSTAFNESGLVEPYICQAVSTGEDSGDLGAALTYCADLLDEMNTELLGALTRLVEPLILILMGIVVGAVAIALFLPLFDLTSAAR